MSEVQAKSLYQVINYIKTLIDSQLANKSFWLKTEISNINFHNSGHCYLDFVENKDGITIAQCRATIWGTNVQSIRAELGDDFNNILKKGGEVLCLVQVTFNQVFGLSLNILQVDKFFALGELERRKQETIKRLTAENLIDKNKVHTLPIVIQRIAVIGSPGTSGHTDFLKQLEKNEYGYIFEVRNFNCQVQGEKAEREILMRLDELSISSFDAIVLIRGGGSKLDLEVFNSYEIAKKIALHNKPILTGIGHETDISIVDIVANRYFKTPSALGAFIVSRNHHYDIQIQTTYTNVRNIYEVYIQRQRHRIKQCVTEFQATSISYTRLRRGNLHTTGNRIAAIVKEKLSKQKQFHQTAKQVIKASLESKIYTKQNRLNEISTLLSIQSRQIFTSKAESIKHFKELAELYIKNKLANEKNFLANSEQKIELYHPDKILDRGYSITRLSGKLVDKATKLKQQDEIEIELIDRKVIASVISVNIKVSKWKTLLTKVLQKS